MLVRRVRAPILAGLLCFVARASAEMTAEDLAAQWSAQRSDIVTAQFKCKYLVNAGQYLRKLSQDDVLQVLSSAGLESGVLDLNRVGRQLFVEPLPGNQYADEEVWFDDGKVRVLELWDGVRETDMVRRPEGDAFYLARSNQVSLYRENESSVAMRDLSEFRLLPEIDPAKSSLKSLPGGTLLVACGDQRIVVDGALRFPVDCTWMDRQGHVVKRVLQRNLTEISGIVLPLLTVTLDFQNQQLDAIVILQSEDVRLNEPIAPETFRVAIPAGVTVADQRADALAGNVFRASQAMDDVFAIPTVGGSSASSSSAAWPRGVWIGAAVGACALLGALAHFWRPRGS